MTCASPTHLRTATRFRRPSRFPAALEAFIAKIGKTFSILSGRRAVLRLARRDARYLQDIGVSRADVEWALSQPWYIDPSAALAMRVERRRAAARWARAYLTDSRRYFKAR